MQDIVPLRKFADIAHGLGVCGARLFGCYRDCKDPRRCAQCRLNTEVVGLVLDNELFMQAAKDSLLGIDVVSFALRSWVLRWVQLLCGRERGLAAAFCTRGRH